MFDNDYYHIGRTMCEVLEEMRQLSKRVTPQTCHKFSEDILYLIEEVQVMGNRMEDGLSLKHSYEALRKKRKRLKDKVDKLEARLKEEEDDK